MTITSLIPLRWSDLDAIGHLNNAVYLTLCEQARVEALRQLDAGDWSVSGPVVAEATVRYRRPITEAGTARVETTFGEPGRTSLPTTQTIRLDGHEDVCADADIRLVWVDSQTGQPTPVPDALRAQLVERADAS